MRIHQSFLFFEGILAPGFPYCCVFGYRITALLCVGLLDSRKSRKLLFDGKFFVEYSRVLRTFMINGNSQSNIREIGIKTAIKQLKIPVN